MAIGNRIIKSRRSVANANEALSLSIFLNSSSC